MPIPERLTQGKATKIGHRDCLSYSTRYPVHLRIMVIKKTIGYESSFYNGMKLPAENMISMSLGIFTPIPAKMTLLFQPREKLNISKISNILSQLNWSMLSHKLKVPNPIYIMRSIFWIRIFLMAMLQILYSGLTIGFRMKICSTLNSLQKKLWAILWLAQGERCKALQRLN